MDYREFGFGHLINIGRTYGTFSWGSFFFTGINPGVTTVGVPTVLVAFTGFAEDIALRNPGVTKWGVPNGTYFLCQMMWLIQSIYA